MKLTPTYVLISAVRNEENYLPDLITCIAAQTVRPVRWIIVDDGSSDRTLAIAKKAQNQHPFIDVVRMPSGSHRSFASQVYAAQHGYKTVMDEEFAFIGFLDADIRIDARYYESLLHMMDEDPAVGLTGGAVVDRYGTRLSYVRKGSEDYHVPGGVQFFRRACYEAIGGYKVIDGGGQDTIADIMTMMHGWKVQVVAESLAFHLRPDGVNSGGAFQRGMRWGRKFYLLGYHPIYFLAQSVRRWSQAPLLFGALFQMLGFVSASIRKEPRPVSCEFVTFLRSLQIRRLKERVMGGCNG